MSSSRLIARGIAVLLMLSVGACRFLPGRHPSRVDPVPGAPATISSEAHPIAAPGLISAPVAEPLVDLKMVDAPVSLILQRLADIGGLQLIVPGDIRKTLSVQYINVPVSVALDDVLERSGLQLGAGREPVLPFDTVTVFYRLPANVDSMSADAIVRRFGVSRKIADLIVKSRRPD